MLLNRIPDCSHFFLRLDAKQSPTALCNIWAPDDADDTRMEHAPVNTDDLESTFGCLDYLNGASHAVDIWSNFG